MMQKIISFLEKNVEWFCIGIGLLFMGWCAYAYIFTPVTLPLGASAVRLDNVDDTIKSASASRLDALMNSSDPVPPFKVDEFSTVIRDGLSMVSYKAPALASTWDFQPLALNDSINPNGSTGPQVKELPTLPPAQFLLSESGLSTVTTASTAAPADSGASPADSTSSSTTAPASGGTMDLNWVTIAFSLPSKPLSDGWTKAFGPEKPNDLWKLRDLQVNTEFLTLSAYRSEKLADGKWSDEVEVPRLFNNQLSAYPTADKNAEEKYATWAVANAVPISTPAFPAIAPAPSGNDWKDPVTLLQSLMNPAAAAAPAAPAAPATPLSPPPAVTPTKPGSTPRGAAVSPPASTPLSPPPAAPDAGATPQNTDPNIQKGTLPSVAPVPVTKDFNPVSGKDTAPDILVYLHDKVDSGKIYRYRIGYRLYNPLFNFSEDRAVNKAWVSQFALEGPRSDYTPEINIPFSTFFYCAQTSVVANQAGAVFKFEVFTWSQGQWHKHMFPTQPGDEIGGVADGIDYSTGYTYVEARYRNDRLTNVLVADRDGNMIVRNASQDANGEERKQKALLVPAPPAAAPAAAGSGTPPADNGGAMPAAGGDNGGGGNGGGGAGNNN
ncbi:MAG: hypothetical protein M3O30_16955 [Planctomycetota bacterium]|nr:hypothetical protein [Planctomycetota bacterium]